MEVDAATVVAIKQESGKQWVLLGQNTVKNWIKSTKENTVLMRYPGELKFFGGTVDSGEHLAATAHRELCEELLIDLEPDAVYLDLFNMRRTRPIQGRSYNMYNFIAQTDSNPWLRDLDLDLINARLQAKEDRLSHLLATNAFWSLPLAERYAVSPEVHRVAWFTLPHAIQLLRASMLPSLHPINEYQRSQFALYGLSRRDPMYQSMVTLQEVEAYLR